MHKTTYSFLTILTLISSSSLLCMKPSQKLIPIQLTDSNTAYMLEKWQIKESNTLYKKYLVQKKYRYQKNIYDKSLPLSIAGISTQELKLFDDAIRQNPSMENKPATFKCFYDNLSPEDKINLIITAGKRAPNSKWQKLNAKRLTAQLVMATLDNDNQENIANMMGPSAYNTIVPFLTTCVIKDNVRNNLIINSEPSSYVHNTEYISSPNDGRMHPLPQPLTMAAFNGIPSIKHFKINQQLLNNTNAKKDHYIQRSEYSNLKAINLCRANETIHKMEMIKTIQHTNSIITTVFSKNSDYIASSSLCGQLMLTHLTDSYKHPIHSDINLIENNNEETCLCFNHASTVLATAKTILNINENIHQLTHQITLWDPKTKQITSFSINTNSSDPVRPLQLFFNQKDNRILIILKKHNRKHREKYFSLWNIDNLNEPYELTRLVTPCPDNIKYISPFHTEHILIPGDDALIVLDEQTGQRLHTIALTSKNQQKLYKTIIPISTDSSDLLFLGVEKADRSSCIKIIDWHNKYCFASIKLSLFPISHLCIAPESKSLMSVFSNRRTTINTELYNEADLFSLNELKKTGMLNGYILWRLIQAKKTGAKSFLHKFLCDHMMKYVLTDENGKRIIQKYLLN